MAEFRSCPACRADLTLEKCGIFVPRMELEDLIPDTDNLDKAIGEINDEYESFSVRKKDFRQLLAGANVIDFLELGAYFPDIEQNDKPPKMFQSIDSYEIIFDGTSKVLHLGVGGTTINMEHLFCHNCGYILPDGFFTHPYLQIPLIGTPSTGKTCSLMGIYEYLNTEHATDRQIEFAESEDLLWFFGRNYYSKLYRDFRRGNLPTGTQKSQPPLFFKINKKNNEYILVGLIDAAGEEYKKARGPGPNRTRKSELLWVFVPAPFFFDEVDTTPVGEPKPLTAKKKELEGEQLIEAQIPANNDEDQLVHENLLSAIPKDRQTRLAFTLSQADKLKNIHDTQAQKVYQLLHLNKEMLVDFDAHCRAMSEAVRPVVERKDRELLWSNMPSDRLCEKSYFAISALGDAVTLVPVADAETNVRRWQMHGRPTPLCVVEPLLWLIKDYLRNGGKT
ncbi:MAG: hypothetical protein LBN05_02635 [Oscillospiraceae bacterium]|nr:hypothetical protein [Oscillospiraceae bacterium]